MSSTMQVDTLAEKIKTPTRATFLTSVFKNGLKKKLSHLNVGCISVVDGKIRSHLETPIQSYKSMCKYIRKSFML